MTYPLHTGPLFLRPNFVYRFQYPSLPHFFADVVWLAHLRHRLFHTAVRVTVRYQSCVNTHRILAPRAKFHCMKWNLAESDRDVRHYGRRRLTCRRGARTLMTHRAPWAGFGGAGILRRPSCGDLNFTYNKTRDVNKCYNYNTSLKSSLSLVSITFHVINYYNYIQRKL